MSGRRPLQGGAPRLLGNHGGAEGKAYRRAFDALAAELGPFTTLQAMEAGRVSAAWVELQGASRELHTARRTRRVGRGRRPNLQAIERLARRQGRADSSYAQALERLKQLCAANARQRAPMNGAELLARLGRDGARPTSSVAGTDPRRLIHGAARLDDSPPLQFREHPRHGDGAPS